MMTKTRLWNAQMGIRNRSTPTGNEIYARLGVCFLGVCFLILRSSGWFAQPGNSPLGVAGTQSGATLLPTLPVLMMDV
jgi:hypothetical protein